MDLVRKQQPRPTYSRIGAGIEKARNAGRLVEHSFPLPPPPLETEPQYAINDQDPELPNEQPPIVTVYEGGTTPPSVRLCMLGLALVIVALITVVVIFIVTSQHKSHSLKPGQFSSQPVLLSNSVFLLKEDGQEKQKSLTVLWPFRLPEQIQEAILLPSDDYIPNLSLESATPVKISACCFCSKRSSWICDGDDFEIALVQDSVNNRPKLSVFINSYLLAGSQCSLEVEMLT